MTHAPIGMLAVPDLSGIVRGKSFGTHRGDRVLREGLAWVPANILISPFAAIPPDNPFGPMGEITLRAVEETRVQLPGGPTTPAMDLYLARILDPSGAAWAACPRAALEAAVADLAAETGLTMRVAFEHEFILVGGPYGHDPSFSLAAIRRAGAIAVEIDERLLAAGMEVEQVVPEFGGGQYEIASTPKDPLRACDEAVLAREIIRDVARRAGIHATFAPKAKPTVPGNGIHVHFSLWDDDRPAMAADGWLTREGGAFAAGLLAHAEALLLFTTGSTNSFLRIRPHNWVGAYTCVGTRNREAMVRFCPRSDAAAGPLAKASLEFRVVDATANVYLALAAIIRAGLDGLRRGLAAPPDIQADPADLPAAESAAKGVRTLPDSLAATIAAAVADQALLSQFPPLLVEALLCVRRDDVRTGADLVPADLAARLAAVY